MTTQTNVNRSNETIQQPVRINKSIMQLVILTFLVTAAITIAYLLISLAEGMIDPGNRAIEAQANRYQGLADMFAKKEAGLELGWQASTARYQGLASFHASSELPKSYAIMAARYQGLANHYAQHKAALERGWDASSARYQGLANYFEECGK